MRDNLPYKRKSFYFLRSLLGPIILLGLFAGGLIYFVFRTTPEDFTAYHTLMTEANPTLKDKKQKTPYKTSQQQKQVRKDLFSLKNEDRLHFMLSSDDVNLILDHQHGKTELTEELLGVACYAQQALFFADLEGKPLAKEDPRALPWQKILQGSAKKAFFSYQNKTFNADCVNILGYEIQGHQLSKNALNNLPSQPLLQMEAQKALYDGTTLSLLGNIYLEHPHGSIAAEKSTVVTKLEAKSGLFETIAFENDVLLTFKEKGVLSCQKASFNYKTLQGHFCGDFARAPLAVYRSTTTSTQNHPSITLKGHSIDLSLKNDPAKPSKYLIDTLLATGEVSVDYNNSLNIQSDRALYRYSGNISNAKPPHSLPGTIDFDSDTPNRSVVTHSNGDCISGSSISIDTNHHLIYFKTPKGQLKTQPMPLATASTSNIHSPESSSNLNFQTSQLQWDLSRNRLCLKGSTEIQYGEIATLKNDQELRIDYSLAKGQKQLHTIEAEGHTVLHHSDFTPQRSHWVICDGTVHVDHEKMIITLNSVRDSFDNVCERKQVLFYDDLGEAQADKVTILYQEFKGKFIATKITLEGNVYLVNHKTRGDTTLPPNQPLHYTIADVVEYTPLNKEMYFTSLPGHRVLFEDKINHLQISAPTIKIIRDATSKRESIKGMGDVRFHFLDSELEQLRKHSTINF